MSLNDQDNKEQRKDTQKMMTAQQELRTNPAGEDDADEALQAFIQSRDQNPDEC